MTEVLYRAHPTDLEVRSSGEGRTIVGLAVPFDTPADIYEAGRSYTEVFKYGAFARTIAERGPQRVKAMVMHDRQRLPIGRAEVLREDTAGLYAELRVSRTDLGDQILELVKDGALDALSIGFTPTPQGDRWDQRRRKVERVEVKLREVSVVDAPAYEGALISAVRSVPSLSTDIARRRLDLVTRW